MIERRKGRCVGSHCVNQGLAWKGGFPLTGARCGGWELGPLDAFAATECGHRRKGLCPCVSGSQCQLPFREVMAKWNFVEPSIQDVNVLE